MEGMVSGTKGARGAAPPPVLDMGPEDGGTGSEELHELAAEEASEDIKDETDSYETLPEN